MNFILTEELVDSIIFAMENQEQLQVLDAAENCLIPFTSLVKVDEENYYKLPEWTSADGFKLREEFVSRVYSPIAHQELQEVLHSGRGVFKNFRIVLKKYPEIDKLWHVYKRNKMSERVNDWYNSLREVWGLEKLDKFSESDEYLVHEDFSFEDYNSEKDKQNILLNINAALKTEQNLPEKFNSAVCELWNYQFNEYDKLNQTGVICRNISEDFAGCITASKMTDNQQKVMVLTSLFVTENYCGLGIGTELICMCISKLKTAQVEWFLIPDFFVPEFLEPLLIRMGFEKTRAGYLTKL